MKLHIAMPMRKSNQSLRVPVLLSLTCAALALLSPFSARAGLSEPDAVVFGSIVLNGVPVTAASHAVVVEARRSIAGPVVASYEMGSSAQLGNQYVLRLPVEDASPLDNPSASLVGDKLLIVVRDASGDRDSSLITLSGRGVFVRVDFGDVDTDGDGMSDRFEKLYFGSITGGDPNLDSDGDGRPNLREFLQGTNPLVADGRHPADTDPADDRLTISEVTAYTTAWLTDTPWSIEPKDIPTAYATRAAALWKGGEVYVFTNTPPTNAPMWWANAPKAAGPGPASVSTHGGAQSVSLADLPAAGSFTRVMKLTFKPGFPLHVEVQVTPRAGVTAYAIEEHPPAGWLVRNVSGGGRFRSDKARVKWGLFYDDQPRIVSYDAVPLMDAGSTGSFDGLISFDGANAKLAGPSLVTSETAAVPITILNVAAAGERGLAFDVQGAPTASYNLEGSSDLTKWTPLQTFTTDASGRAHLAPTAAGLKYFFRITAGPAI
ncbi:MAG: hypothetical protein HYR88_01280 [Verrucomicrobia bacterium]|nr:hypothetical protein [Verrucomicrobiota bacterium]